MLKLMNRKYTQGRYRKLAAEYKKILPEGALTTDIIVWGPGQKTPVHDHLTWGLVGVLRGRERATNYQKQVDGTYKAISSGVLLSGQTTTVSPTIGDVHRESMGSDSIDFVEKETKGQVF